MAEEEPQGDARIGQVDAAPQHRDADEEPADGRVRREPVRHRQEVGGESRRQRPPGRSRQEEGAGQEHRPEGRLQEVEEHAVGEKRDDAAGGERHGADQEQSGDASTGGDTHDDCAPRPGQAHRDRPPDPDEPHGEVEEAQRKHGPLDQVRNGIARHRAQPRYVEGLQDPPWDGQPAYAANRILTHPQPRPRRLLRSCDGLPTWCGEPSQERDQAEAPE